MCTECTLHAHTHAALIFWLDFSSLQAYQWLVLTLHGFFRCFPHFLAVKAIYYSFTSILRSNKLRFANEFQIRDLCVLSIWIPLGNCTRYANKQRQIFLIWFSVCVRVHLKSFILSIYVCQFARYSYSDRATFVHYVFCACFCAFIKNFSIGIASVLNKIGIERK